MKAFIMIIISIVSFRMVETASYAEKFLLPAESGIVKEKVPVPAKLGNAYVADRIYVKLNPSGSSYGDPLSNLRAHLGNAINSLVWVAQLDCYQMNLNSGADIGKICRDLKNRPEIAAVSPDYIAYGQAIPPDDPWFQYQYGLNNTGQVVFQQTGYHGKEDADIDAVEAWEWSTGNSSMIIAIIDSGVAIDHEDLKNQMVAGYDIINDDFDPYDDNGHGTYVASIAGAETNNGIGIAGVCWNAKIMPIKVLDSSLSGTYSNIALGIRYAVDHNAKVINLSLGGAEDSFILEDACHYAYKQGCVLVASSGNTGGAVLYPAAYDKYCLAVGASDAFDNICSFSNVGRQIDVVAPGYYIAAAFFNPAEPANLSNYAWFSGTSVSAPFVSGAAALLLSQKSTLTPDEVINLIKYTSDDINSGDFPGPDNQAGYGRLNINRLLGPYVLSE